MIQRGEHLRLAADACNALGIVDETFGQDLQRDVTTELGVVCPIDEMATSELKRLME